MPEKAPELHVKALAAAAAQVQAVTDGLADRARQLVDVPLSSPPAPPSTRPAAPSR